MRHAAGLAGKGPLFGAALRLAAVVAAALTLANCNQTVDPKYGVSASARVIEPGQPVPKGGGVYRVGKPYTIAGKTYTPEVDNDYRAEGMASWYGDDFHGRYTANGEVFDMNAITAAHPTLPLPSYVRVTNLRNKRSLIVRVNDRGPYAHNRLIDLSRQSAKLLGFQGHGVAPVRVEFVGRAPLAGSDDARLLATLRFDGRRPDGVGGEFANLRNTPLDDERPRDAQPRDRTVRLASTQPYAPEFFDARPMTRIADVPAPAGRPYAIGEGAANASPGPSIETRALPAQPAAPLSAAAHATPTSPVSAYAPVRYDRSAGLISGRGLY